MYVNGVSPGATSGCCVSSSEVEYATSRMTGEHRGGEGPSALACISFPLNVFKQHLQVEDYTGVFWTVQSAIRLGTTAHKEDPGLCYSSCLPLGRKGNAYLPRVASCLEFCSSSSGSSPHSLLPTSLLYPGRISLASLDLMMPRPLTLAFLL